MRDLSYAGHQPGSIRRGFGIQKRVVGALIMRDLHTRFGRHNIGYLWLIGEPMMLASVIGLIHAAAGGSHGARNGMSVVPFGLLGYCVFIVFRGIFNRSEGTIENNAPLFYHKTVSIFDIVVARSIVEAVGCTATLILLMGICVMIGVADPPARPLYLIAGVAYMVWWATAAGMIVVAYTYKNHLLARLVHPVSYFSMPISGMAFAQQWWTPGIRNAFWYNPMVHIFEIARHGMFRTAVDDYISYIYLSGWCAALTLWGLVAIERARRDITM